MGNKEILKEKERSRMRYDDIETEGRGVDGRGRLTSRWPQS